MSRIWGDHACPVTGVPWHRKGKWLCIHDVRAYLERERPSLIGLVCKSEQLNLFEVTL
jgi:hypothetical protein